MLHSTVTTILITWALFFQHAAAQTAPDLIRSLRFPCSQLVHDRVDPLVNPGRKYTAHLHQIVGGNSFNLTMDPATFDIPGRSTCTTCQFTEDLSNYWTAVLFFRAKNGTFKRVPQVANGGLNQKGGMTVYYIPNGGKVTAFRKGFRMLAGDAAQADPSKVSRPNICHRCWTADSENTFVGDVNPCGGDTVDIPADTKCRFIRQTIIFPGCWDGKNLDSPNHQSHVAYGTGRNLDCPTTHSVKIPQIMYEIMWDVRQFRDQSIWPSDGKPFVYSMDLGGSAAHGDYLFGWKGDTLQRAMDNGCAANVACPAAGLTTLPANTYNNCNIKQQAPEVFEGWLASLPAGNPEPSPQPSPKTSPKSSPVKSPEVTDPSSCVATNNQCGGALYTGPTNCCGGSTCQFKTSYYSQCR